MSLSSHTVLAGALEWHPPAFRALADTSPAARRAPTPRLSRRRRVSCARARSEIRAKT
jgi:hypothetical protein